jgi:hypothetical protein
MKVAQSRWKPGGKQEYIEAIDLWSTLPGFLTPLSHENGRGALCRASEDFAVKDSK